MIKVAPVTTMPPTPEKFVYGIIFGAVTVYEKPVSSMLDECTGSLRDPIQPEKSYS